MNPNYGVVMDKRRVSALHLLVEGQHDAEFLRRLLPRAGFDLERIRIDVVGGKEAVRRVLHTSARVPGATLAALVDADERNVPDARAHARRALGEPDAEVFCAVPTIEAWLFADANALLDTVAEPRARELVARLPLPEEIPFPKQVVNQIFKGFGDSLRVIERMDVAKACARSPSLHVFLSGLAELLGERREAVEDVHVRSMPRDVFSNLVAEVMPADVVIYKAVDGTVFTAEEMIRHIREGTAVGRQYSSDLLRISRDFLARRAVREARG